MTPEIFAEKFEVLAEAPGGVKKIRELILELAVRGRLVEQDPGDPTAMLICESVACAQRDAVAAGEIERLRQLPPLTADERTRGLPPGWFRARLQEVALAVQIGPFGSLLHQSDYVEAGIPVINPANIRDGVLVPDTKKTVAAKTLQRLQGYVLRAGDVVMGRRGEMGRCAVVSAESNGWLCGTGSAFIRLTRAMSPAFVALWYGSPDVRLHLEAHSVGSTMNNLNLRILNGMFISLPPLPEQQRIVAKVDQLMALCDELETTQLEKAATKAKLRKTALESLARAEGEDEIRASFARVVAHFEALFDGPESVAELRQGILELAVRGRLVEQEAGDGRVELVLEKNDARRGEVARRDHRADIEKQTLLSAEDRWDIAANWAWRGLADLVLFVDYRGKTPVKLPSGIRLLTAKNVRKGYIDINPEEFVSEVAYHEWMTRGLPKVGDVLFTTEAPMGNAAVVKLTERFALAQRVICFQSYGAVDPEFLTLQILSMPFQRILDKNGTGMTAKGIKASKLKQLPIAIPPLPEQKRIVAKIDHLMSLCDTLEAQLQSARDTAAKLVEAVVSEVCQGAVADGAGVV